MQSLDGRAGRSGGKAAGRRFAAERQKLHTVAFAHTGRCTGERLAELRRVRRQASLRAAIQFPAINGQNNRSNFFLLDGINNQGAFTSTYAVPPIIDTIQEFKVQSHNDQAEFGGALGGIINVVTKSGTNEIHGSAWEFLRNNALDARNPFLLTKTPFRQNQYGCRWEAGGDPEVYMQKQDVLLWWAGRVSSIPGRLKGCSACLLKPTCAATSATSRGRSTIHLQPGPIPTALAFIRDPFPGNIISQQT